VPRGRCAGTLYEKKMKKFFLILATILAFGMSVYFVLFYSSEKLDQLALAETNKIIVEVEQSISKNNEFPDNVGKLIKEHNLRTNIRFGLLHTEIKTFENNGDHFIEYFQSPFGPYFGYNFESREWYSTE
jgi:hypothetical protein